ncbi:LCP family protein [Actinomyces minihominis]|uniref:LCP family protein n=1 Tax=Actinomyces minihominis TaxID=2002838 RepID=UPI000C07EE77|nr:LCP family protein [Actinomyces minihominis]
MSHTTPPIRTRRPAPSTKNKLTTGGKIGLTVLAILVVAAVAVAATIGWFITRVSSSYEKNTEVITEAFPDEETRPAERTDKAQTILLLGSDRRGEIDESTLDGPQDSRSDTIMLMHIPADREGIYFTSIMRDSWVDIPGFGEAKINAAMAYGGIPLTVQVVEGLIGTRIDNVVTIDFTGFEGLTNALGGVTLNNTVAFESNGHNFPLGEITLNGEEALSFVRARKPFVDGDYQRVRNQQAYMKGVVRQLISADTLTNPARVIDVVDAISPYLAVTEGMTPDYIVQTAASLRNLRPGDLYFMTAPTIGVGTSADGQSIILLDPEGMAQLRTAFEGDTLAEYYAANS